MTIDDATMKAIFTSIFGLAVVAAAKVWTMLEKQLDAGIRHKAMLDAIEALTDEVRALRSDMQRIK